MISFFVPGRPIPQGSAKAFVMGGKARVVTGAKNEATPLGGWRARIAEFASKALETSDDVFAAANVSVGVSCYFYFDRPKSSKAAWPTSRRNGDIDKLIRAVLDGLTGVLIADDSQVVTVVAEKCWAGVSTAGVRYRHDPGVAIEMWTKA